jgi:hypothetical protein
MKLLLFQLVIFGLATTAFADDFQNFSITTNEEANVKQILKSFEKGETALFTATNNEEFREIVGYYLLHSYEALAGLAVISGRLEIVQDILPKLIALKNEKQTSKESKLHLISILLFYSMKTDKKNIFIKTLEGENIKEILQDDAVRQNVTTGCELFKGKDIEKIRQELESATSSTNSVSSPPR